MNKGFEELNQYGVKGIAAFWLRILSLVLPIGLAIFSLYWIVLTSSKIWIASIGGQILTANVFLTLVSLASFVSLLFCWLDKQIIISIQFTHHLFAILSFIGQVICCILMSLSSSSNSDTYLRSIEDYCERNPSNNAVTKFILNNPSAYSRFKYVMKRSADLYPSISAFFAIWFASTITYLLCSSGLAGTPPENSPLLSNQQQQQESQHESEHHDDHPDDHDQIHDQGQPENGDNQPWVLNADNEFHDDDEVGTDQEEINITTNTNNNQRQNESQNSTNANPDWVNHPETENSDNKNPSWAIPQSGGGGAGLVPNYEYSYEEEDEI